MIVSPFEIFTPEFEEMFFRALLSSEINSLSEDLKNLNETKEVVGIFSSDFDEEKARLEETINAFKIVKNWYCGEEV